MYMKRHIVKYVYIMNVDLSAKIISISTCELGPMKQNSARNYATVEHFWLDC